MTMDNPTSSGHSAIVRVDLHVNGRVLRIAQMGPDFLILANPIDVPPTDARIAMSIVGHERMWPVRLRDGISADRLETPILPGTVGG